MVSDKFPCHTAKVQVHHALPPRYIFKIKKINKMEHLESSRISSANPSKLEVSEALKVAENLALKL